MKKTIMKKIAVLSAAFSVSGLTLTGVAAGQSVPDTVKLFSGNNLGSTSFFDGFGPSAPGFTILDYAHYSDFTAIDDSHGRKSSNFTHPSIQSVSNVFQFSYASPLSVPGGLVGVDILLPVVDLSAHANAPGLPLSANGTNIGDVVFGPFYQAFPVIVHGRPILAWRAALDVIAPTGGFKTSDDVNQTSGYWTINPYLAMTILPLPAWEISFRLQYFHNLSTSRASNPPAYPGFDFKNGRAGDALELNFSTSYAISGNISLGINGFDVSQFQSDTTNGITVPNSRATALYIGPGVSVKTHGNDTLNFNVYLPVVTQNVSSGPQLNMQYVHPF